jgi:hypothetical protein
MTRTGKIARLPLGIALWLAARYAVATKCVTQAEGADGWRALPDVCTDAVELRRGDHCAERLRLEREQLDRERQRERGKTHARFQPHSR